MSTTFAASEPDPRLADMTAETMARETAHVANAYQAMARALAAPSEWEPTLPEFLRVSFRPLGEPLDGLAGVAASAMEEAGDDLEPAAIAHARLFLGPFEILAPPYASLFLDPERRIMGTVTQQAAEAYAEAGLAPSSGPREAPDHITLELEFMYFLAFQAATTGDPSWSDRQQRFWRSHLGCWLPDFAVAIARSGVHAYYAALADLLAAFAGRERVRLGRDPDRQMPPSRQENTSGQAT